VTGRGALRYCAPDGTDHTSHPEQASMIRRDTAWRNRRAGTHPRPREIVSKAETIGRAKVAWGGIRSPRGPASQDVRCAVEGGTVGRVQYVEVGEAQRLLGQVLAAVERGELGADGPAAAALVHRLQGALLALQAQGRPQGSSSTAPRD
jgi:hypothetical protein